MLFETVDVQPRGIPVVVEIPHAGTAVPDEIAHQFVVGADAIARDADLYVDELFARAADVGAAMIRARLSRYVVDLNRDEGDVDALAVREASSPPRIAPRGVIWRETTHGEPVLRAPLTLREFEHRLANYYRPYQLALADLIERTRDRHGHVLLIAAHSMPSTGRGAHGDAGQRRADIVPGTRGRTTACGAFLDAVEQHFRAAGLSVRHDEPYRGGATVARWGRPDDDIDAVQIEINRALYMNETSLERRGSEFDWIRGLCTDLVERCGNVVARWR